MARPRRHEYHCESDYLVAFLVWLDRKYGTDIARRAAKWRQHEREDNDHARKA